MDSSQEECVDNLKNTIMEFITDMRENVLVQDEEKADMVLVEFFFKRHEKTYIMKHAIDHILPWKKVIKKRDDSFFIKNRHIFAGIPDDRIDYFSSLWTDNSRISPEDKQVIWSYFDTIVDLIEQYQKKK